jgi:membrane fusion protein, multidrug efflux system
MNAIPEKPVAASSEEQTLIESPVRRRSRGRRALMASAGLAGLLLIGITANWWFTEGQWIESTDNAYVQGHITVLSPRIDGDVKAVLVADNQRVRAGEPLIELDPTDWKAREARAEAGVAEARAAVTTLEAQIAQQRANLAVMAANRDDAAAELKRTAQDAARSTALRAQGWTSAQANDLATTAHRKAEAMLAAAVAHQRAATDQVTVLTAQLNEAEAKRRAAEADLAVARNDLAHTVIRAPFDGIVGNRAAEPGQHVSPGTQLIAVAPPPEDLFVVANFKETQLRDMHPGEKVRLIPDIDPDAAVDGVVDSLAPATGALFSLLPPENATGNFTKVVQRVPVKLRINPEEAKHAHWLRAGLSVTAEVDTRGPHAIRLGWLGSALAAVGAAP